MRRFQEAKVSKLRNKLFDGIGRNFNLVFSRVTMYKMDHPYTIQAMNDFFNILTEGFKEHFRIVLIMKHNQFFIEDESFDSRLNTSRMMSRFKQSATESISFENGIKEGEIANFFRVFCDPKKYPSADEINAKIKNLNINRIKVNYVFYKKMTSDDEVILKDELSQIKESQKNNPRKQLYKEVLNRITEGVFLEEFEKSISLKSLIDSPAALSQELIEKDLSIQGIPKGPFIAHGPVIAAQLASLRTEIEKFEKGQDEISLPDLADAVFEMKAHLLAGIEEQKNLGIIYENENQILDEANNISDRVIIQIVKDEYQKGEISVQRMGQILRRLVSDPGELKRLLPKLKAAMTSEGMPAHDFIELIKEIGKELQSDEISNVLKKSAEKIGVDGDELIKELKFDPDSAAELIYLASEIRNGTGDEKILTELLIDYIERVGSKYSIEFSQAHSEEKDSSVLQEVLSNLGSKIINKLKIKDVDNSVLAAVEKRLSEKIEKFLDQIENNLNVQDTNLSIEEEPWKTTVFKMLEDSVDKGDELHQILAQVRRRIDQGHVDENNYQQIHDEIAKIIAEKRKGPLKKSLPHGVLNSVHTLLNIEKEINRSLRYDTPFSTITLSIFDLKPQKPVPAKAIDTNDISLSIMEELIMVLRASDIVGIMNKNTIILLLPMTNETKAKIALNRIIRKLHASPFIIKDLPIFVQFAGAVTSFNDDLTPDLQSFLSAAEYNHSELIVRLKNLQDLK